MNTYDPKITVKKGETLNEGFLVIDENDEATGEDISGLTIELMVRARPNSSGAPLLTLSTEDVPATITIDNDSKTFTIGPEKEIDLEPGIYYYDMKITSEAGVIDYLEETPEFIVKQPVTRV